MSAPTIHTGDAYILRTCAAGMTSRGGFVWPREGKVAAPDWAATASCGAGLHGFLWGEGDGWLADWRPDAVWVVARVEQWVDLGGKVKFPEAEAVFAGSRSEATDRIIALGARGAVIGCTRIGGDGSTLTGGYGSTLTGGGGSTLTGGDGSTLTAKWFDGNRHRIVVAYVGEDGIEPGVAYRVVNGKFKAAK